MTFEGATAPGEVGQCRTFVQVFADRHDSACPGRVGGELRWIGRETTSELSSRVEGSCQCGEVTADFSIPAASLDEPAVAPDGGVPIEQ